MYINKRSMKRLILVIFISIIFFLVMKNLGLLAGELGKVVAVFSPFILGAGIAFLINVPMVKLEYWLFDRWLYGKKPKEEREKPKKFEREKGLCGKDFKRLFKGKFKGFGRKLAISCKRPISMLLTFILVVGLFAVMLYLIVPQLANTIREVADNLPAAVNKVQYWIENHADTIEYFKSYSNKLSINWDEMAGKASQYLQDFAKGLLNSSIATASSIVSGLVSFFLGLIFAIYLLLQKEKLNRQGKQIIYGAIPEKVADGCMYTLSLTHRTFSKFIAGQCLEACILGLMFAVTMPLFKLPYVILLSFIIGFLNLIPYVGAFMGLIIGALLVAMEDPHQAVIFIVLFLILQQIEANLIYPIVVGNSVGLPSIWVLVAITIGGSVAGVVGMILFIPLFSVLYTMIVFYVKRALEKKDIDEDKWKEPVTLDKEALTFGAGKKAVSSETSCCEEYEAECKSEASGKNSDESVISKIIDIFKN